MAASADHLKALVQAHAAGDEESFYSVALQVAAKAARQGHNRLANDLKELIDEARARPCRVRGRFRSYARRVNWPNSSPPSTPRSASAA